MNDTRRCLTEEEIFEAASDPTPRTELFDHANDCGPCLTAITRARQELRQVRDLVDDEFRLSLETTLNFHGKTPVTKLDLSGQRLSPGDLLGRYRVVEFLDQGGMGEVYRVAHPELNLPLVAKICRLNRNLRTSASDQRARETLLRDEANTLARLADVRNIARIQDLGAAEHGPYMIMEMIPGRSLKQCLDEYQRKPERILSLVIEIATTLGEAHRHGVVHGDLKPGNIIVSPDGRAKLIDFGLARIRDAWQQGAADRVAGGTPVYMAPEQARGDNPNISPATDILSLGLILQELLVGRKLLEVRDLEAVIDDARQGRMPRAAKEDLADPRFFPILDRCLASEPRQRYANGAELAAALQNLVADSARPNPPPKNWGMVGVLGLIAVVFLMAGGLWFGKWQTSAEAQPLVGLVGGEKFPSGELAKVIPLKVGDPIRLEASGPSDAKWFVIWIDSARQVYIFDEADPELPVKIQKETKLSGKAVIQWPGGNGSVPLGGKGGTELLLVVGFPTKKAPEISILQSQLEQILAHSDAWPPLPDNLLIRLDEQRVVAMTGEGTIRGPGGEVREIPYLRVQATVDQIRSVLANESMSLSGEAFPVRQIDQR